MVVATATSPAHTLDAANPTADAFLQGAGQIGYRFFGLVILCAAITSIVGCAYTSVSFLKTFSKTIEKNEKWFIVGFIAISTVCMALAGQPAVLLVLAGALNGLILPITLGSLPDRISEEICYGRRLSSSSIITGSWNRGSCCFRISWNYIIKQLECIICISKIVWINR